MIDDPRRRFCILLDMGGYQDVFTIKHCEGSTSSNLLESQGHVRILMELHRKHSPF